MKWMTVLLASVLVLADYVAAQTTKGKNVIQYGWDVPDTAYYR